MEKQQYRSYIITRASLEETPTQIHNDLAAVYGPQAPLYATVLRWSYRSEEKKMDIEDLPRSGRPSSHQKGCIWCSLEQTAGSLFVH
jgi:hypothetical protein